MLYIDFGDFLKNSGINPLFLPKRLRGADHENSDIIDNPADVIRDPSGRVRGVRALFESEDLEFGFLTTSLRSCAHSCRISANDNEPFFSHNEAPSGGQDLC